MPPSVCDDVGPRLLDPGGAVIDVAGSVPVTEDSSCAKDIICRAILRIKQNHAKTSQQKCDFKVRHSKIPNQ